MNILDDWLGIDDNGGWTGGLNGGNAGKGGPDTSALEAPSIDYAAMSAAQVDAIKQISAFNKEQFPSLVNVATSQANVFADIQDAQMKKSFSNAMTYVLGSDWVNTLIGGDKEAASSMREYARSLSTGALPKDVFNSTMLALGEAGQKNGNTFLTPLRLLNKTTEMKDKSLAIYGNLSQLTASMLQKAGSMTPRIDRGTLGYNMLAMLGGSSMGSSAAAQQGVIQAANTNADLAWSSTLSQFNANMDIYQLQLQQKQANRNMWMQLIGTGAGIIAA